MNAARSSPAAVDSDRHQDPARPSSGTVIWVVPRLSAPSGGTVYNDRVVAALADHGLEVHRVDLSAAWPRPDEAARHEVHAQLSAVRDRVGSHPVVVDGLVGGGMPELFSAASAVDRADGGASPVADVLLVHLPLAADAGPDSDELNAAEGRAVRQARRVVATSRWAAEEIRRRHGRRGVEVISPGVTRPASGPGFGRGSCPDAGVDAVADADAGADAGAALALRPPRLAMAASFTPRKNHRLLGDALEPLLDRGWTLQLAGPGAETPEGASVLAELRRRLPGRVDHRGALTPEAMPEFWEHADLLLLPSWAETFGMVVTEACVHGVPGIVSAGTGAEEALGEAGAACDPGSPEAWTAQLRAWLDDTTLRRRWAETARARADRLPPWTRTAAAWQTLIRSVAR
ncbi:glycosyltransferase family 4 protein [Nesterenkonia halophila]|uniref:glycosyltransferase family 4 protein n=1 Tax=Nesterenkonia halophila TaxID=302044 RepID=UPI001290CD2D|nr:glycosyltransferase family 4 protein [Nesterenkonia halophila]